MFRKILVAVDGSRPSDKALVAALTLAKQQRAVVQIVHIADVLPPATLSETYIDFDMYRDSALATGRDVLRRAVAKAKAAGVRTEPALLESLIHDPAGGIVEEARRRRADLIVIGTHGRTGLARLFLGSVAEGVARHAPTAVLLIRGAASAPKRSVGRGRKTAARRTSR